MAGETGRRIVLASRPKGEAVPENFRIEDFAPAPLRDGEFRVRSIWLSLDPYMRGRMNDGPSYAAPAEVGGVMTGEAVAEVVETRHADFALGDTVVGAFGWATHAVSDGAGVRKVDRKAAPLATGLGVLGMPGLTAWVSLNIIARAVAGETIVVSAATGAVGSVIGQLAKARGLRVIGVAGGAEKCAYAVDELGFDACLDHRVEGGAVELSRLIGEAAPEGVDIYHENVAGVTLEAVMGHMKVHGRVVVCGMIAWYSPEGMKGAMPSPKLWRTILTRRLRVEGIIVYDHYRRYPEFLAAVTPLVQDGRITWRETVAEGLEAAPQAFLDMLKGGNFGKQLVRVGADPV